MKTLDELRQAQTAAVAREAGPLFLGPPDRWFERPHWRCQNGHVSTCYLRTEARGARCLGCDARLVLTFPEDCDDDDAPTGGRA